MILVDPVLIRRVRDPFGCLGNMSPHPVEWQGFTYPTAEHLFQCSRFVGRVRRWPGLDAVELAERHSVDPSEIAAPTSSRGVDLGYVRAVLAVRGVRSPMAAKMLAKRY